MVGYVQPVFRIVKHEERHLPEPSATGGEPAPMKFVERRPFSDPEAAARKLMEIANSVELVCRTAASISS
jgi:hypothetical protein